MMDALAFKYAVSWVILSLAHLPSNGIKSAVALIALIVAWSDLERSARNLVTKMRIMLIKKIKLMPTAAIIGVLTIKMVFEVR